VTAIDLAPLARFCCSYLEMAKTVFNAGTAAGRDDLFERLASLPGADPASFETAQLAFTPGSGLVLNLWGENLRCWWRQPWSWRAAGASHRSCPADDIFELACFDRGTDERDGELDHPHGFVDGFVYEWRARC